MAKKTNSKTASKTTIGSFGGISFYVKGGNKPGMLSFHGLSQKSTASFEQHERIGKKPYLEFIAPGLDELTLTIEANARYRVKPLSVQKKLREYIRKGNAYAFVLGGKRIGEGRWVLTELSDTYKVIFQNGKPSALSFQITLTECVNPEKRKKNSKKKAKKETKKSSGGKTASAKAATASKSVKKGGYTSYTVKKGDTLWGLAKRFYGKGSKYTKIYNANKKAEKGFNKISNPNLILTGWVIKIPK